MKSSTLSISALGAFHLTLDAKPAPKFKYLDARELLLYLLTHTTPRAGVWRGKSKQEIGAALWGDVSGAQLNARFKARLNDVRRVLGAREWVVFEQEEYRFNFEGASHFDVREFELCCAHAETARRAENLDAERAALQQAVALYHGDFMQDYHTRRRQDFSGEREWHLVLREELQNKYRRALERLAHIELDAARFDFAIECLRKLVALDEYDDGAHKQLMLALARQGKRSQALRHYQNILKTRADVAPDAELAALFEKIKRNETLGDLDTGKQGNKGAAFLSAAEKIPPPFQVPADLPRFVGRVEQFEILKFVASQQSTVASNQASVIRDQSPVSSLQSPVSGLCLVGMGGIGKTSLAIHAAYRLREQFPDGVLWGNLRESEPLAILASWERAYGCDFSGLPDLNARAASFRSLMHDKRVLVILDDVTDAADARPLLLNGAQTRTIFTTRSADIAAALDAFVIEMPVLHAEESADLLTRILGNARVAGQETFANEICTLLGNLPLALDITAHRLVSRPTWTLREMVERLRAQMRRLDELQLADRAVRATFALSWDALNEAQKIVLAHVGVFDARSFTADALAYVVEVDTLSARDILDALVALSLVSLESHTRYRQHPLLADFSQERLRERVTGDGENQKSEIKNQKSYARLCEYYLSFATTNRKNYLALEDEWDNLNVGIEIAHAQEMWQAVIDYGDVLTDAWFARGRFTDARKNYPYVMRGARELEEQDPYINASLNWGKACIDQGDYAEAEEHLQHGLQTSREVNDEYNIANALFLLGRVSVERSEYDAAQKFLEESQEIRERIGDRAGVAETLYMQGRIKSLLNDFDAAIEPYIRALQIQETLPVGRPLIITLRWLAMNEGRRSNFGAADEYSKRALSLSEQTNDVGELAATYYGMAFLFKSQAKYNLARDYAEKSLQSLRKIGDRKIQAHIHFLLSDLAAILGENDNALSEIERCLGIYYALGDTRTIAAALLDKGDILHKLGRSEEACSAWSEGFTLAKGTANPYLDVLRTRIASNCDNRLNLQKRIETPP